MRATSVTFGVNMSDLWHFSTIKMERDTTVYALWAYAESDGVATTKN